MAAAVQYPRHASPLSYPDPHPILPYSSRTASILESPSSLRDDPGALAASRSWDHAKFHKRPSVASSRSNSRNTRLKNHSMGRAASVTSSETSDAQRSIAKDRFKANFKKLTQQKNDDDQITLDLSKTAEENEQRSGLGIYSQRSDKTAPGFGVSAKDLGAHNRTVSYGSQYSASSPAFKPSTPFAIPMRQSPRPRTPSEAASYSPSVISSGDPYMDSLSELSQGVTFAPPRTNDSPSFPQRPRLRVNTTDTDSSARFGFTSAYGNTSQTNIASSLRSQHTVDASLPRRNTNRSTDTVSRSNKSPTSIDRAFSFMSASASPPKSDLVDPLTRAASIQAARQAFQEREEAKERKHELREQKAAAKAKRKTDAKGLGRTLVGPNGMRIKAPSQTAAATNNNNNNNNNPTSLSANEGPPMAELQRPGTAYANMPAGPAPDKGEKPAVPAGGRQREKSRKKASRTRSTTNLYLRLLSWLRTRLSRLG